MGSRLGELAEDDLIRLAAERIEEGDQLDFKTTFAATAADREELAKDVCAFANASGGLIVYGIADEGGHASSAVPVERPTGELRARVASILRSHSRPSPPFDVMWVDSSVEGRGFVVVAVPKSADAPHARIRNGREPWLQFPIPRESVTDCRLKPIITRRWLRQPFGERLLVWPFNDDNDTSWKHDALRRAWGSTVVAHKGDLVDATGLPPFAEFDGRHVGLLTHAPTR